MRNLFFAMFAVAAAFIIVLGLGFAIHWKAAGVSDRVFGTVAALAIAGFSFLILYLLSPSLFSTPTYFRRRIHGNVSSSAIALDHKRRIAELAADPVKRKYAALMERGEWWTDDQILYDENLTMVATCAHLQTIEYAMRLAGLKVRLNLLIPSVPASVTTYCRINEEELKRRFLPAESIHYREYFQPERSEWDNPTADLLCTECRSRIFVVHPREAREDTPWFP
jgi:hypothetical protein